ncbi:hypothetical protein COX85_01830 [Candidatus Micrarchaeota archaeon CG_4_10_14_0_2_um_filter_55_9]|nr:MAG: hypothetical protein COT57_02375 [Candidatus Micrarchaeota archaeon CG09_land_8_20_14_0_10_55_25]PIZ91817.1 MAG: hypothetical protein COX85_01830 [Candidatus Micrarchaeota archaeon CG_4_10_14_0_2_um_filter_55_9]PJD00912.1 MAG: hypothetical protein COU38_03830 [Candidatus Micrarchaeota archaeon CG10_big_fil_rev_8_21_14_0_10_54_18]
MMKTAFYAFLLLSPLAALEACATLIYVANNGETLFSPEYGWNVNAESIRFSTLNSEQVKEFNGEGKILYAVTKETKNNQDYRKLEGRLLVKPYVAERAIDFTLLPENKVEYACGGDEWSVEFVNETLETPAAQVSGEFLRVESQKNYAFGFDGIDSASHFYVRLGVEGAPIYYPSGGVYRVAADNNVNYLGCCEHSCVDKENGCKGTVLTAENKCVGMDAYRYQCALDACVPVVEDCVTCDNAECTALPEEEPGGEACVDSDGGLRPFEKGGIGENEDSCDGLDVIEWYCENGEPQNAPIQCEHGCENGACREAPQCIQGDSSVLYGGDEFLPYCSVEGLVEYSCEGSELHSSVTPCNCVGSQCAATEEKVDGNGFVLPALAIIIALAAAYLWLNKPPAGKHRKK